MRFKKDNIKFDEIVLLAGEERLHLMFFGFVDVPDGEVERRVQFRDDLDSEICRLSGAVNRRKIWKGDSWVVQD